MVNTMKFDALKISIDNEDAASNTTSCSTDTPPMSNVTKPASVDILHADPDTIADLVHLRSRAEIQDVKSILRNKSLIRSILRGWAVEANKLEHFKKLIAAEGAVYQVESAIFNSMKPIDVDAAMENSSDPINIITDRVPLDPDEPIAKILEEGDEYSRIEV